MATKFYYLKGKAKWVKARKPDEKYGNYTMNLYLDEASEKIFEESGLQIEPKQDEEGTFYTFRRPHEKMIKREVVVFGPPGVFNADNTEFDGLVGNGSRVTIKVSVYDTIKGKGHRWESIRVEELVEYNPEGGAGSFESAKAMPPPEVAAKASAPKAAAGRRSPAPF